MSKNTLATISIDSLCTISGGQDLSAVTQALGQTPLGQLGDTATALKCIAGATGAGMDYGNAGWVQDKRDFPWPQQWNGKNLAERADIGLKGCMAALKQPNAGPNTGL